MKQFHIGDVLSITHEHLVSPRHMDGVYDILNYMTGDSLFTHQLPRAGRECKEPLLAQHPELASVDVATLDALLKSDKVTNADAVLANAEALWRERARGYHESGQADDARAAMHIAQRQQELARASAKNAREGAVASWLAEQSAKYGEYLDVVPLVEWTTIDPIIELESMVGKERIVTVNTPAR